MLAAFLAVLGWLLFVGGIAYHLGHARGCSEWRAYERPKAEKLRRYGLGWMQRYEDLRATMRGAYR